MESREKINFQIESENKEIEMEDTSSLFLPADILYDNVKPYLKLKNLSKLARTCKGLNALFQKPLKVELLISLLEFVAKGEKEKADMKPASDRTDARFFAQQCLLPLFITH